MTDAVLVDTPAEGVRRITLNRPDKRNALNHAVRGGVLDALREADEDPEVRVSIIRGAGSCFSAATSSATATRATTSPTSPREARASGPVT